ncbi:MAG TPA: hypothetical protein VIY53_10675 [Acidobacteriaceae bacterium]
MNAVALANCPSDLLCPKLLTAADSADLSLDELTSLYLLSFLLVADKVLAESCFNNAMEDYLRSSGVSVAVWARTAGQESVIRNAVQITRPAPKLCFSWSAAGNPRPLLSPRHQPFAEITSLSVFERFVYVLCALLGYSDDECAALLNCDLTPVTAARDLANRFASAPDCEADLPAHSDSAYGNALPIHEGCGIC